MRDSTGRTGPATRDDVENEPTAADYSRARRLEDPRINRRAAHLTSLGRPKLARRLLTCVPRMFHGFPCGKRFVCLDCTRTWGWRLAERWKRCAFRALARNRGIVLYAVTLTCGSFRDWRAGVEFTKRRLRASQRWTGSWSKVLGFMYVIEIVKRGRDRFYVHLHGVVALYGKDMPRHPAQIPRRWARMVQRKRVQLGLDRHPKDVTKAVDRFSRHNSIKPLFAYRTSAYLIIADTALPIEVFGSQVAAIANYATHPDKERARVEDEASLAWPLTVAEEVDIGYSRVVLTGATGIFGWRTKKR